MKILIIGNGFDLAHGLPTSYNNFLDFVKACKEYHISGNCDDQYTDFCAQHNGTPLFNEIIEHTKTSNRLLTYFLGIYEKRCADGKRGWIDFESEISMIIQKLDMARKILVEQAHEEVIRIPPDVEPIVSKVLLVGEGGEGFGNNFPESFKDGKVNELLDGLNRITRLLEIYLTEFVGNINTQIRESPIQTEEPFTHILSFNYTDTFQKLYDPAKKAKYCYIHGEAKKDNSVENCNLVLGIDEYLDPWHKDNENYFVWFKKFYQRILKGTDSEYMDWIQHAEYTYKMTKQYKPPKNEVYIYGHSLDVTDKDILSKFILMNHTKTYVFYYSKDDLAKKIENLVKVIGEDELIDRTGGEQRTLLFVKARNTTYAIANR